MNHRELIQKAVSADNTGRVFEAIDLYKMSCERLEYLAEYGLLSMLLGEYYTIRAVQYANRASDLEEFVQYHINHLEKVEEILVSDKQRGPTYGTLLQRYLDDAVREVVLQESLLISTEHFGNLIALLETLITQCPEFNYMRVVTLKAQSDQMNQFHTLVDNCKKRNVVVNVEFKTSLTGNSLLLSNGYIVHWPGLHMHEIGGGWEMVPHEHRPWRETKINISRLVHWTTFIPPDAEDEDEVGEEEVDDEEDELDVIEDEHDDPDGNVDDMDQLDALLDLDVSVDHEDSLTDFEFGNQIGQGDFFGLNANDIPNADVNNQGFDANSLGSNAPAFEFGQGDNNGQVIAFEQGLVVQEQD